MIPWLIIFNAISIDGSITEFDAEISLYYELASKIGADAVLMGSETLLKGFDFKPGENTKEDDKVFSPRNNDLDDKRPLLVVPDSRGRIRFWSEVLEMPYIRDVVVLCSRSTSKDYLDFLDDRFIPYIIVGYDKVDLKTALEELNSQFGIKLIRVDSGSVLNSELFNRELVDELHVLIHPFLVGSKSTKRIYDNSIDFNQNISFKIVHSEIINDKLVYLKYEVIKQIF